MNRIKRFSFILLFVLIGLSMLTTPVFADDGTPGEEIKYVFGGSYHLSSGDTLESNLAIFGGVGTLDEDSTVEGDVFLTGGVLSVFGEVEGNVVIIGGALHLGDTAVVEGDVTTIGSTMRRSDDAIIKGDIVESTPSNIEIPLDSIDVDVPSIPSVPDVPFMPDFFYRGFQYSPPFFDFDFQPLRDTWGDLFKAVALAALGALVVLILPKPSERVGRAIAKNFPLSAGLGLLTIVIFPWVVVVMAITLVLIPVIPIMVLVLLVAGLYGWIALGLEIGKRLAVLFKQVWVLPISAGVGIFLLSLVTSAVDWIPCIGWILGFLIVLVGLGGVLLTFFGSRDYPPRIVGAPEIPASVSPSDDVLSSGNAEVEGNDQG